MDGELILRFLGAFAVIGALLYGFAYVAKAGVIGGAPLGRRSRLVEVIETTPLPNASSIHVVKVAEAYYVLGRTQSGISMLGEVPKDVVERAGAPRTKPLPSLFLRLQQRRPVVSK